MIKKIFSFALLFLFSPLSSFAVGNNGAIEIAVSPIRFDIAMNPGESSAQSVKFYNKDTTTSTFTLTTADCVAGVDYGTPKCTPSASTLDPIHASGWITFDGPTTITVPPNSDKTVRFTIHAPSNAVPGGHYGAIFFNNPLGGPVANSVTTAYRIGPLFLIKINGDIVYNTSLGNISVSGPVVGPGGGGGGGNSFGLPSTLNELFQSAPNLSNIKWDQIGTTIQEELNPFWDKPDLPKDAFLFTFDIPLTNSGNTHIKPTGRIELFDDNGNPLKSIGKETVKNKDGVFLGEKIVDYLPINDEEGNVLPNTSRNFPIEWKGFAYEGIEDGKAVIKFQTPSAYYSQLMEEGNQFLWPWERMKITENRKHLRALVTLEYTGKNGQIIPLDTQKEIEIEYPAIIKTLNYGVIVPFVVLVLLALYIIQRKRNRIEELEEEIDVYEEEIDVYEGEVDEFQHARDMAKKALQKKELKKKNQESAPSTRKPRRKNTDTQSIDSPKETESKSNQDSVIVSQSTPEDTGTVSTRKKTTRKTVKPE